MASFEDKRKLLQCGVKRLQETAKAESSSCPAFLESSPVVSKPPFVTLKSLQLFVDFVEMGPAMLPRVALNSWTPSIFPSQAPNNWDYKLCVIVPDSFPF